MCFCKLQTQEAKEFNREVICTRCLFELKCNAAPRIDFKREQKAFIYIAV